MENQLVVKSTITIQAPKAKVWDALTNPEQTKKYMFGCEAVSDWKPGSSLLWKGSYEGKEMIFVKGTIKAIQPEKHLTYTVIDPNNKEIPDIPENYLTVTIDLNEEHGDTSVVVTQGDYSKVAEGEKRYQHTVQEGGWEPVLIAIKKLVEES